MGFVIQNDKGLFYDAINMAWANYITSDWGIAADAAHWIKADNLNAFVVEERFEYGVSIVTNGHQSWMTANGALTTDVGKALRCPRHGAEQLAASYGGNLYTFPARFVRVGETPVLAATTYPAGVCCMKCNGGNPYAVPNRPEGKYLCFKCRT